MSFSRIRVAGIKQQIQAKPAMLAPDGMSPTETFNAIQRLVHELVATQYDFWKKETDAGAGQERHSPS